MTTQTIPQLFDYSEAAEKLRVSEKTLRRYVYQGKIQHRKIGRFVRFTDEDIVTFIASSVQGGEA